jgi:hypothetical protein
VLDLQPHHLAGAQATAITETEQHANLEATGDGQQATCLVRAHHLRDLLHLARSKALSVGLSNAYFKSLGLPSLIEAR